jgi:hypothetical protein
VQVTTGQKLIDYLRPRLFDPLGFEELVWEEDPQGINTGGFGLMARTEEIAAFGLLYLQKGEWRRRRLIDPAWVEAATSRQIATPPAEGPDWEQGYGYQFWQSRNGYRGDGAFGQYCIVVPRHDLVVAVTSGIEQMARVLVPVWDLLLPALRPGPLAEDSAAHGAMERRLQELHHDPGPGERSGRLEGDLARSAFRVDENKFGFETIRFEFGLEGGALVVTRTDGKPSARLEFGRGAWRIGSSELLPEWRAMPLAVSGAWARPDAFEIDVNGPSTPFRYLFDFNTDGSSLQLSIRVNLSFGLTSLGSITARRDAQG